jgi:hypothetical protein
MKKLFILLFAIIISVSSVSSASAQCAMCKATVESNSKTGNKSIGKGLNTGIIYLMVMPYITIGIVGYLWYRNSRKNAKGKFKIAGKINTASGI